MIRAAGLVSKAALRPYRYVSDAAVAGPQDIYEPGPYLPVPLVRQCTTYSCGAAALQSVLMYWGKEFTESELMARLHTDPQEGTAPKDIVRVAQEEGLQVEMREQLTLQDIEASLKQKVPVIVDAQAWRDETQTKPWQDDYDDGHYLVVIGMDKDTITFMDPSMLGSRGTMSRAEFEDRWHDEDKGVKTFHLGIFVRGPQPQPPPTFMHVD